MKDKWGFRHIMDRRFVLRYAVDFHCVDDKVGLAAWQEGPKLPRVATDGGFCGYPRALADLIAGPLQAQKHAKVGPGLRYCGTDGDAPMGQNGRYIGWSTI